MNNQEILGLENQGYKEGDFVPGKGTLLPDGTFSGTDNSTELGGAGSTSTNTDPFISELRNRLLSNADMISSSSNGIQGKIEEAISGVKSANESSKGAISSSYERAKALAQEQCGQTLSATMESQRGFGVNVAALNQISKDTERKVNDLEQRKQELILSGDAESAKTISGLILQELQFEQKARQDSFSNLLNIGNFTLNEQGRQDQVNQFQDTMKFNLAKLEMDTQNDIAKIALEFGLKINPGETLKSITSRAAPLATQK